MNITLVVLLLIVATLGAFVFATLAYSLRDYSRATLGQWFEQAARRKADRKAGRETPRGESAEAGRLQLGPDAQRRLDAVVEHEDDLALVAAVARTGANLVIVLAVVHLVQALMPATDGAIVFAIAFVVSLVLVGVVAVALPLAVSSHASEPFIGRFATLLRLKRFALAPVILMHAPLDRLVRSAAGRKAETPEHVEEEIEKEILDIVAEGRDEGVIDDAEHDMIERTIRFQDTTAGEIMTPRGDVVAIKADAAVDEVINLIEETGYSRIPVYRETLDRVEGVLHARDLFQYVGKRLNGHDSDDGQTRVFDIEGTMRPPLIIPETKPLSDLLRDMQLNKRHMAIVLDEYGGTSGVVTIEDVIEELVGEIEDEHDEDEDGMFVRVDDRTAEMDARVEIEALNRAMGLNLPEEESYSTVGGFVTTTLDKIPSAGASFEHDLGQDRRLVITVLEAEPQRVNRVRVEVNDAPAETDPEPEPQPEPEAEAVEPVAPEPVEQETRT